MRTGQFTATDALASVTRYESTTDGSAVLYMEIEDGETWCEWHVGHDQAAVAADPSLMFRGARLMARIANDGSIA